MKKISTLLLAAFLAGQAFSQTEKFDIIQYTPPADWKKDAREGVVLLTHMNATTGGFCLLALYAATVSTGDAEKDFQKKWKDLAVPLNAETKPKTEIQEADGWKAVSGASAIKADSLEAYVLLTVVSGFGKASTIMATFNDASYIAQIDSFMSNMDLDKNGEVAKSIPEETNKQDVNPDPGSSTGNSILGVWSTTSITIGDYVSPSGSFIKSADVGTMDEYTFRADNTYLQKFFGMVHGVSYYTETTGTYKVSDGKIYLTPLKRQGGYGGTMRDEQHMLNKPTVIEYFIGPTKWEPGPFLNLHQEGKYYMWSDFPYDYFKKVGSVPAVEPAKSSTASVNKTQTKAVQKAPVKKPVAKTKTTTKSKTVKKTQKTN